MVNLKRAHEVIRPWLRGLLEDPDAFRRDLLSSPVECLNGPVHHTGTCLEPLIGEEDLLFWDTHATPRDGDVVLFRWRESFHQLALEQKGTIYGLKILKHVDGRPWIVCNEGAYPIEGEKILAVLRAVRSATMTDEQGAWWTDDGQTARHRAWVSSPFAHAGILVNTKYVDVLVFSDNDGISTGNPATTGRPRRYTAMSRAPYGGIIAGMNVGATVAPDHGVWTINDRVLKRDFVAGGKMGWVCTTAGYGVRGAWVGSTAYQEGQQVTNDGKLYRCVVAGTSAGSGGPTHTSGEASDGGATWEFISDSFTIAEFKEYGAIDM